MKLPRWIRNLHCRWFGHRIELVEYTASVLMKVSDGEWSTETATRNLRTCHRCGWIEPYTFEVAPPKGSTVLISATFEAKS